MASASPAPRAESPSSLVGEIVDGRFALVDEVGPDGAGFRYVAFDTVAQHEVEVRVMEPETPGGPCKVEQVGPVPAASGIEARHTAAPAPLKRIRGEVVVPKPTPCAESATRSSTKDPPEVRQPSGFGPAESDWFSQGESLAEQPPLTWVETDVDARPRVAAGGPARDDDTAERRYRLSWAAALADD